MARHIAAAALKREVSSFPHLSIQSSHLLKRCKYLGTYFRTKSLLAQATFRIFGNQHNPLGAFSVCSLYRDGGELAKEIGSQINLCEISPIRIPETLFNSHLAISE